MVIFHLIWKNYVLYLLFYTEIGSQKDELCIFSLVRKLLLLHDYLAKMLKPTFFEFFTTLCWPLQNCSVKKTKPWSIIAFEQNRAASLNYTFFSDFSPINARHLWGRIISYTLLEEAWPVEKSSNKKIHRYTIVCSTLLNA